MITNLLIADDETGFHVRALVESGSGVFGGGSRHGQGCRRMVVADLQRRHVCRQNRKAVFRQSLSIRPGYGPNLARGVVNGNRVRIPTMAGSQSNRWRAAVPTDRGQLRGSAIRFMPPLTGGCSVAAGSAWFKLVQARPRYQ